MQTVLGMVAYTVNQAFYFRIKILSGGGGNCTPTLEGGWREKGRKEDVRKAVRERIRIHRCTQAYTHTNIHTHTYTNTHIHMHT